MNKGVLLTRWNTFAFYELKAIYKKTPCIAMQGVSLSFIVDCGVSLFYDSTIPD